MKKDNLKQFYKEFPSNPEVRVKALKSILEKKGLIDQKALDEILDTYQNKVGPLNGAKIVAKAWTNKEFKVDLINNTDQVLNNMDLNGRQGEHVLSAGERTVRVDERRVVTTLGMRENYNRADAA